MVPVCLKEDKQSSISLYNLWLYNPPIHLLLCWLSSGQRRLLYDLFSLTFGDMLNYVTIIPLLSPHALVLFCLFPYFLGNGTQTNYNTQRFRKVSEYPFSHVYMQTEKQAVRLQNMWGNHSSQTTLFTKLPLIHTSAFPASPLKVLITLLAFTQQFQFLSV